MANTSTLKEIDDKFCLCSICLEQLKDPKLLPCLHRFCKDCLRSIIQGSHELIKCPECRGQTKIPTNGVDGFKTDFYSKSLVEYVQIQQSLKSDEIRECYSCSKHLRVAAYCFKCNDFLCKDCHHFHVTNKIVKDHQKHTLTLEDIEAKKISIEKLAAMRDAPRCDSHPEKISELCCKTCKNLPVCVACMHGEHKGHTLHEVKSLAKCERKNLAKNVKTLEKIEKEKIFTSTHAKEKLMVNVNTDKETVIKMHDDKDKEIMPEIQDIEGRLQEVRQEKQNTEKEIFDSVQKDMEREIQGIRNKYDDILKLKKIEINDQFHDRERSLEKELEKLRKKRERFHRDKKELLESIEKQLNENLKIIETMSERYDNIRMRLESLNVLASSILVSENDWSAVQCIPNMCTAAENLMRNINSYPLLTTLTDLAVNYKQYSIGKQRVTISDHSEIKIKVKCPEWSCYKRESVSVCDITTSVGGNIAISGLCTSEKRSFISVYDMNGVLLKGRKFREKGGNLRRYCKYLSQHKVASVLEPNEIGLYNARCDSYTKKNISDVINSWPEDRNVTCVATDPVNNQIFVVGHDSTGVYVFDDQLNYLHILTLPEIIQRPRDITVSDEHLLVCDGDKGKCYVFVMDKVESKLVDEFIELNVEENEGRPKPLSVCTDQNDFVYILWQMGIWEYRYCIVQYKLDGGEVLTTRKVGRGAWIITVVGTSQGEKLLVFTHHETVYVYDLTTEP